jgi:hypothetical protein
MALPFQNMLTQEQISTIQDADAKYEEGTKQHRQKRRLSKFKPWMSPLENSELIKWAERLMTQPANERCDRETLQIIWRAVIRANYFWDSSNDASIPLSYGLVPKVPETMAMVAMNSTIGLHAKNACDACFGEPQPPDEHIEQVQSELTSFLNMALNTDSQAELADLPCICT